MGTFLIQLMLGKNSSRYDKKMLKSSALTARERERSHTKMGKAMVCGFRGMSLMFVFFS